MRYKHRQNPDDIASITADGREVSVGDRDFEQLVDQLEHDGHDADLIYMARPMLEGNEKQQRAVYRLLRTVRDEYVEDSDAQLELLALLNRHGLVMGRIPHTTEAEFNAKWDTVSGSPKGNSAGNYSFGHSDATRREANRQAPE